MTAAPRPAHRWLSPRQPVRRSAALLALALAVAACSPAGGNRVDDATAPVRTRHPDLTVTVPALGGTAGTDSVARLPNPLRVHVGQTLRIHNDGRTAVQVGPFLVDGGTTVTQRFLRPGRLEGTCLAHPDGRLVIDVRA